MSLTESRGNEIVSQEFVSKDSGIAIAAEVLVEDNVDGVSVQTIKDSTYDASYNIVTSPGGKGELSTLLGHPHTIAVSHICEAVYLESQAVALYTKNENPEIEAIQIAQGKKIQSDRLRRLSEQEYISAGKAFEVEEVDGDVLKYLRSIGPDREALKRIVINARIHQKTGVFPIYNQV